MHWQYFLDGFEFHDQFVSDDEIQTITAVEFYAFVVEREINLLLKWDARHCQLISQRCFVSRFQQCWSRCAMSLHAQADAALT